MFFRIEILSTRTKIGAVIAGLSLFSLVFLAYFMTHSNRQQKAYRVYSQQQASDASNAIADIWENYLYWVIYDFSTWDEMVEYAADPAALHDNQVEAYLDSLQPWYEIDGVWIFNLYGDLVYENKQLCAEHLPPAYFSSAPKAQLHEATLIQYYRVVEGTLVLIQGATIHHTEDVDREGEPQGYMFFAKCWSGEPIELLKAMTGSDVAAVSAEQGTAQYMHEERTMKVAFRGKEGEDAAFFIFQKRVDFADLLQEKSRNTLIILLSFTIIAFVALLAALHQWVNKPLQLVARTIKNNSKEHIPKLKNASKEFAMIGELTETFIQQKEDLKEQKEKAEEANRLKTAFLANVSHEIRTPMTGVMGFSELLKSDETLSREEQKEYLDVIYANGQFLLLLIDDLIDLAKIDSGNMTIKKEKFDVHQLMLELFSAYRKSPLVSQKDLKLLLDIDSKHAENEITTDRLRLHQVLSNLLSNAIKFTESGKVTLGYRFSDDADIRFFVSDTGPGIAKEDQEKIYERFVQLDLGKEKSKQQGTGLGLSISQEIMKHLGGKIQIESTPGAGTTFTIILPANPQATSNK